MGRGNGELFDSLGLLARNIQATAAPFPQQHLSAWRGAVDMRQSVSVPPCLRGLVFTDLW